MAKQLIEIIEIDCCYPSQKDSSFRPVPCVRDRDEMKKFEETEDCFILEFDPDDAELDLSKLSISDKNAKADLLVLAEKGKVACRDFPHPRHACAIFPFRTTPRNSHCKFCYCYVCDLPAPCKMWVGNYNHCFAFDNERWNTIRKLTRQAKELQKQEACRPHQRHACVQFPFKTTSHERHCELCYCYVCEVPAPCEMWVGSQITSHCHAFSNERWRTKMSLTRQERELQNKQKGAHVTATQQEENNNPVLLQDQQREQVSHNTQTKTTKLWKLGFLSTMADGDVKKGTVNWFNDQKGFGFITPDDGTKDLFVHQSSIKSDGFRSLGDGESVEYQVDVGSDGRTKAANVTGPDGASVQGSTRGGGSSGGYGRGSRGGDRGYGGGDGGSVSGCGYGW